MLVLGPVMSLVLLAPTGAVAETPGADLMDKLAAHAARMDAFTRDVALTINSDAAELDGDGKVRHTVRTVARQTRAGGKPVTRVLSSTKDGQDNVEGAQEKATAEDKQGRTLESPFASRNQPRYRFTVIGPDPLEASLVRIGFGPKGTPSKDILQGEASVDPTKGEVVRLWARPSENPPLVDKMEFDLEYEAPTSVGRMLSKLSFFGAGGVLFFKRGGKGTLTFRYESP